MIVRFLSLLVVLLLSGFSSLGYELAWVRLLAAGLGHEYVASLSVVAAFFFGLSLGAVATDGVISRSRHPDLWYAGFEITIGVWAVVLTFIMPHLTVWMPRFIGVDTSPIRHWLLAFLIPLITLLPATAAMGGTLTALDRIYIHRRHTAWSVGRVYSLNTLGAAFGIGVTVFVMLPLLGYAMSIRLLALINLGCAATIFATRARQGPVSHLFTTLPRVERQRRRRLVILFWTGFLSVGVEVLAIRGLSQVMEGTVYTFSCVLAVYLTGNALGAGLYHRYGTRIPPQRQLSFLTVGMSIATLYAMALLSQAIGIHNSVDHWMASWRWRWLWADVVAAVTVLFLPTVFMGALFTHLAQSARRETNGLGMAVGVNTLGGAMAPLAFGIGVLPIAGLKIAFLLVAVGYLLIAPSCIWRQRRRLVVATSVLAVSVLFWADLQLVSLNDNERIVAHVEGVMTNVTVFEDDAHEIHLSVDNHYQMGGTGSFFTDRRQTHIPLLLHPNPHRVLFLGVGTGTTVAAVKDYPGLTADGVELIPEMLPLMQYFKKSTGGFQNADWLSLHVADARRFVVADTRKYDVIIADLFHPARDGAASLYTREHFLHIQQRLEKGGIFCQWLPLYQLDSVTLKTIIRTYLSVFNDTRMFMAHYGVDTPMLALISTGGLQRYPGDWFETRVTPDLYAALKSVRLTDPYALFGAYMAGPVALQRLAGEGPLNTDDHPLVMFSAPSAIDEQHTAGARLLRLLEQLTPQPTDIVDFGATHHPAFTAARLKQYFIARNRYIAIGAGMPKTTQPIELVHHAAHPLLATVRISSDFSPAYDPILGIASRVSHGNPNLAARLLVALQKANPARQEAGQMLEWLKHQKKTPETDKIF